MLYFTSRAIHIWRRSSQYACPRTRFSLFVFHDGLSAILFYYFLSLLDPALLPLLHPAHVFFIYTPESGHRSGRLNGKQYGNSITFRKRTKKKCTKVFLLLLLLLSFASTRPATRVLSEYTALWGRPSVSSSVVIVERYTCGARARETE